MEENGEPYVFSFSKAVLDQLGQGVTVLELDESGGSILRFANSAYADMIGYSPVELIGRSSTYLRKFCADELALKKLISAYEKWQRAETTLQVTSRNGDTLWVHTTMFPLNVQDDGKRYVVFVHDNVSAYLTDREAISRRCDILEKRNRELESLSLHDPLTGLHNRRFFDSEFKRLCGYHARRESPVAVGFIDVDHFKAYNDHYGHQKGDEILRTIGGLILEHFSRVEDLCVRFGGEEFVVVTGDDVSSQSVYAHFERFRNAVEKLGIARAKSSIGDVLTVSVGVFHGLPQRELDEQYILRRADGAMYRAKKHGRNRTVLATGDRFLDLSVVSGKTNGVTPPVRAAATNGSPLLGRSF